MMIFWYMYGYRPLPRKLLLALSEFNVTCFTKYLKISEGSPRFFCAYLYGMYDFICLTPAIVCGEIDLCWNFESGFRRRISKKKNHDCIVYRVPTSMMKKYILFFFKTKRVEMYYSKCDKMIMMPLFWYNVYYVVILQSFLRYSQFRGHNGSVLENRHRNRRVLVMNVCMNRIHT